MTFAPIRSAKTTGRLHVETVEKVQGFGMTGPWPSVKSDEVSGEETSDFARERDIACKYFLFYGAGEGPTFSIASLGTENGPRRREGKTLL